MKRLKLTLLFAFSCLAMASCGDNDDDDNSQKIAPAAPSVIGNWSVVRFQQSEFIEQTGQPLPGSKEKDETQSAGIHLMKFCSNGAFHEKAGNDSTSGTYTHTGSKLALNTANPLNFKTGQYDIDSLTTSRLIVRDTLNSATAGVKIVQRTTLIR